MHATPDPYLREIIDLTAELQTLYARQCCEAGDRDRLAEINGQLETKQRQRNVWRAGGDPLSIRGPLPELLKDMRTGERHWKARRNR